MPLLPGQDKAAWHGGCRDANKLMNGSKTKFGRRGMEVKQAGLVHQRKLISVTSVKCRRDGKAGGTVMDIENTRRFVRISLAK
jgi:hypothetical protein